MKVYILKLGSNELVETIEGVKSFGNNWYILEDDPKKKYCHVNEQVVSHLANIKIEEME